MTGTKIYYDRRSCKMDFKSKSKTVRVNWNPKEKVDRQST